jgi:hypothetical protein
MLAGSQPLRIGIILRVTEAKCSNRVLYSASSYKSPARTKAELRCLIVRRPLVNRRHVTRRGTIPGIVGSPVK